MRLRVIGIDCATKAAKAGLAAGFWDGSAIHLDHVSVGKGTRSMAEEFPRRIREIITDDSPTLFALDAPLGWPAPLADGLAGHLAGERIAGNGLEQRLFRRLTDLCVKAKTDKTPLEVGANFIARTAHAALELLAALRKELGHDVQLLWTPGHSSCSGAIEVYPAATLRAHGAILEGYKSDVRDECESARSMIVDLLDERLGNVAAHRSSMIDCDHSLDAVACVLAAADFLRGDVVPPTDEEMPFARREGWIWFKPLRASRNRS
jgi:hypothetical protein